MSKQKDKSEQGKPERNPEYELALAVVVSDFYSDNLSYKSHEECRKLVDQHKEELRHKRSQVEHTEDALCEIAAQGKGSALVLREEVEGMRERMGYGDAGELEKLLIERVILCWLRMTYAEKVFARERTKETSLLVHQEFTDRQAMRANIMYLRSVDALNRFRLMNARIEEIKSRTPKAEPNKGAMLKAV